MWSFITILSTELRSFLKTVRTALLQSFNAVNHLIQIQSHREAAARILILISGSYLVDLLFTLFESSSPVLSKLYVFYRGHTYEDGTFWNGYTTQATFWHGLNTMFSRAMILSAAYISVRWKVFVKSFAVCFWIEVFDMLDYWLFYNAWWVFIPKFDLNIGIMIIKDFEFEYNFVKISIVLIYCYIEWRRLKSTGYLES
jgi:hypothetical protein